MTVVPIEPRSDGASTNPQNPRKEGFLPMKLVAKDNETALIQASVQEVKKALQETHGVALFKVRMIKEAAERTVLVRKIDLEPDKKRITGMTLQEVADDDVIRISIPIEGIGTPSGVEEKTAVLERPTGRVRIRCAVSNVPMSIAVPISDLAVGKAISAKDIELPEGVEIVANGEAVLFNLRPRGPEGPLTVKC